LEKKESFRKVEHTAGCWSPLVYKDMVRACIHRYKFTPVPALGQPLGLLAAQCALDHPEIAPDVVTWTPLSRKSLKKRGFDQAQLLAEELARVRNMTCMPLLRKIRNTKPQSSLKGESERRANVLGAYRLYGNVQVAGKRILLVDDVMTTGATLSECARVLLTAGAGEVVCLTLAMAGEGGEK
jgi:ComF family protein